MREAIRLMENQGLVLIKPGMEAPKDAKDAPPAYEEVMVRKEGAWGGTKVLLRSEGKNIRKASCENLRGQGRSGGCCGARRDQ